MDKVDIIRKHIGNDDFYDMNGTPLLTKILAAMDEYAQQQVKNCSIPDVRLSLPTDEEIKQKAFDFSYVFRDDEDCKRSDAVETYCEEMGHWIRNKIQGNEA